MTLRSLLWASRWRSSTGGGSMITLAIALTATNAIGSVVQAVRHSTQRRGGRDRHASAGRLIRHGCRSASRGSWCSAMADRPADRFQRASAARLRDCTAASITCSKQAHFVPISILKRWRRSWQRRGPESLSDCYTRRGSSAELMAIASFGALAFASVAATPLMRLFFGASIPGCGPSPAGPRRRVRFICFGYLNDNLLLVLGLQRRRLMISLVALVVNVAGNLILVPIVGFMGAAWMTLATEAWCCGASLCLILRETRCCHFRGPVASGRTLLAAVLFAGALSGARLGGPLVRARVLRACAIRRCCSACAH